MNKKQYKGILFLLFLSSFALQAQSFTETTGKWKSKVYLVDSKEKRTYEGDTVLIDTIVKRGGIIRDMNWVFSKDKVVTQLYGIDQILQFKKIEGAPTELVSADGINRYRLKTFEEDKIILMYTEGQGNSDLFWVELTRIKEE